MIRDQGNWEQPPPFLYSSEYNTIVVKGLVYGFSLLLELPLVGYIINVGQRIVILSSLHQSLIDSAKFPVRVSNPKHLYTHAPVR
jgi:hypothetical protein